MTNKEYCEIMDNSNFFIDSANPYDMKIKEALEKQIPKGYMKELFSNGYFKRNICPKCEDVRGLIKSYNFCPWCGQAIDWSDGE